MKKANTRRALALSFLSLLLCASMLIGTTFAWFTDSASTAVNSIQSGTLDVDLQDKDGNSIVGQTLDFIKADGAPAGEAILWEPGCTYTLPAFKVVNLGSLALKYKVAITGITGNAKLLEAIEFTYTVGGAAWDHAAEGELLADAETELITITGHMKEEAGNEYQGLTVEGIGITVYATQLTHEYDSEDNLYDGAATYLNQDANGNWLIGTAGDLLYLAQQVNGGNAYRNETILLTADIDLGGREWTPIGSPSRTFSALFDGQGHSVSNFTVDQEEYAGLFGDARNGGDIKNLTVKNANIKATDRAGAVIGAGYTTLVNCHAENCTVIVTPALQEDGTFDGGAKAGGVMGQVFEGAGNGLTDCTAKNVTVIGYRDIGAVLGMAHNNNTVTDCKAADSEVCYFYLEADQVYGDGTPNENIGAVVGRIQSSATVSGSVATNVKTNSIIVYGVKLVPGGNGSTTRGEVVVSDKEGLLNLSKLTKNWIKLFSDGLDDEYSNFAPNFDYYYYRTGGWFVTLTDDIDLGGAELAPIDLGLFSSFDGGNHLIKNAKVKTDPTTENEAGLFKGNYCAFKDLKLDNIHVTGSNVGNSTAGVVSGSSNQNQGLVNVTITNSSVTGGKYTGGVIGYGYTDVKECTLENVTVKGGYKLGGVIGYICASGTETGDVYHNTLTDCTVDGIGGGVFAGGKDQYVMGKLVGNYNCNGLCTDNTVTNMTTSAIDNIGAIEAGLTVKQTGDVVNSGDELQDAINGGSGDIVLGGDIDLGSGGIVIP